MSGTGSSPLGKRPLVGLADLVRAWAAGGRSGLEQAAAELGYERDEKPAVAIEVPTSTILIEAPEPSFGTLRKPFAPIPFLRAERYLDLADADGARRRRAPAPPARRPPPSWPALVTWHSLAPRLARLLGRELELGAPDVPQLVERLARLELPDPVPRRALRRAGAELTVLADRAFRLAPIWRDQDALAQSLTCRLEGTEIRVEALSPESAPLDWLRSSPVDWRGRDLLVLGDLGLAPGGELARAWSEVGRRVRQGGGRALALLPHRMQGVPRAWESAPWDAAPPAPEQRGESVERLLILLSALTRVDRGLVRELRRAARLPGGVALELALQAQPAVDGRHAEVLALEAEQRARWMQAFPSLPAEDRAALSACLPPWRACLGPEVGYEELLTLAALNREAIEDEELERATAHFAELADQQRGRALAAGFDPRTDAVARYLERAKQRTGALSWGRGSSLESVGRAWYALFRDVPGAVPPPGLSPAAGEGPSPPAGEVFELDVFQRGDRLVFAPLGAVQGGRSLGRIRLREPVVVVEPPGAERRRLATLEPGGEHELAPLAIGTTGEPGTLVLRTDLCELRSTIARRDAWQTALGRDRCGLWCAFELEGVEQRLRWIPPGTFWMGTPLEEQAAVVASWKAAGVPFETEWIDREGPRHRVTISRGFWLGETPVKQEQWEAVMGTNPSRFHGADLPVEQVSWDGVQEFLEKANRARPELELRLPLECEWEHACRGGAEEATYAGAMAIRGLNDAPVLEGIAWYGGNSAEGSGLEDGEDNSSWKEKSGRDGKARTHPVGEKESNPFGLFDMLGNVWEWCADGLRPYGTESVVDPPGPDEAGIHRVVRGGAWHSAAGSVRAGYRRADPPSVRWFGFGFRLAQGPGALGQGESRAEPGEGEPRGAGRGTRPLKRGGRRSKPGQE